MRSSRRFGRDTLSLCLAGFLARTPVAAQQFPPLGPSDPTPPAQSPQKLPLSSEAGDLFSSGFFLKLGFSFMVGLAVGYALKVAFKIALVVGGLLLVALFALQYSSIVDVNWSGMESSYDGLVEWLAAYAGALKDFMAENLSGAASFTAGLLLGLRL